MNTIKKFQDLQKNLFQFGTSDLDFGIYQEVNGRIKNDKY